MNFLVDVFVFWFKQNFKFTVAILLLWIYIIIVNDINIEPIIEILKSFALLYIACFISKKILNLIFPESEA